MKLRTYCLTCREHTDNIISKRVAMTQKDCKSSQKKEVSKNLIKEWSLSIIKQTC